MCNSILKLIHLGLSLQAAVNQDTGKMNGKVVFLDVSQYAFLCPFKNVFLFYCGINGSATVASCNVG